jgi:tetratricopeptide (TPR) repeat protein
MNDIKIKESAEEMLSSFSAGTDFEEALALGEQYLREKDPDRALAALIELEIRYVDAVKLFDLIGDALIMRGDSEAGVRYKTFHEVMKASFKTTLGQSARSEETAVEKTPVQEVSVAPAPPSRERPAEQRAPSPAAISRRSEPDDGLFPRTAAMGHEFMRQGHFDRAQEIFETLADKNPEDKSLREARDMAGKKSRERRLLGVFQRWLKNIETMKTEPSER